MALGTAPTAVSQHLIAAKHAWRTGNLSMLAFCEEDEKMLLLLKISGICPWHVLMLLER